MVYQISDTEYIIFSPISQVVDMNCKNGSTTAVHLDTTSKIHIDRNCHIRLQKHTITSDLIIDIESPPLSFSWTWDPLSMPADSLEDASHLDFMLYNLQSYVAQMESSINDVSHIDDLLISTISQPYISKFSIFVWTTTIFVSLSLLFKTYQAFLFIKPILIHLFNVLKPAPATPSRTDFLYLQNQPPFNTSCPTAPDALHS